mgnify:CR=1 FL=1
MLNKINENLWIDLKRIVEIEFTEDFYCNIRYLGKENEICEISGDDNCQDLKKALDNYYSQSMQPEISSEDVSSCRSYQKASLKFMNNLNHFNSISAHKFKNYEDDVSK